MAKCLGEFWIINGHKRWQIIKDKWGLAIHRSFFAFMSSIQNCRLLKHKDNPFSLFFVSTPKGYQTFFASQCWHTENGSSAVFFFFFSRFLYTWPKLCYTALTHFFYSNIFLIYVGASISVVLSSPVLPCRNYCYYNYCVK